MMVKQNEDILVLILIIEYHQRETRREKPQRQTWIAAELDETNFLGRDQD